MRFAAELPTVSTPLAASGNPNSARDQETICRST